MKIIVISDIHGIDKWKQQVQEPADLYIFLGDYFDSWDIPGEKQIENFRDIVQFYQDNLEKVVLLTGNHDLSYINFDLTCSGFQHKNAWNIKNLLEPLYKNGDLKACKVVKDHIFVHAGISKTWCETYNIDITNLETEVNELFRKDIYAFGFQDSKTMRYPDGSGDNIFQSPLWIRPLSLDKDRLSNYTYVVGHTRTKSGLVEYVEEAQIYFTDCQENGDDFLKLEIC